VDVLDARHRWSTGRSARLATAAAIASLEVMSRSTKLFVCTKVLFTLTTPTAYDMYYPFAGSTVYNYLEPSTSITPPVASTLVPPPLTPPPPKNRCSMASFGFNRSLGDHVNARSTKS
jgi:hypothetical protein